MDPNHKKLQILLTNTVLQFCRQNGCFEDELRIQGTVCVTSDSCSIFVTQLSEIFSFTNEEERSGIATDRAESLEPAEQKISNSLAEPRSRKWLKRRMLREPATTRVKKARSTAAAGTGGTGSPRHPENEAELGVVKVEQDEDFPQDDSTVESGDSAISAHAHIGFLGFGDDGTRLPVGQSDPVAGKPHNNAVTGDVGLNSDAILEYSYNQAEYIAAMNREGASAAHPLHHVIEETTNHQQQEIHPARSKENNHLSFIEKKGPDKYRCTMCDKEYNNRGSIYRHIDKHLGRSFSCDYCGSTFESHSGWTRHIRNIHAQMMQFSCDKCPQKFYQRNALDQHHARVHTKDEPPPGDIPEAT